jgi:hypothetical protein
MTAPVARRENLTVPKLGPGLRYERAKFLGDEMSKEIDWQAIKARWGDGSFPSNRQVAAEFGISETAIRKKSKEYGWPRDLVRERIDALKRSLSLQIDGLEREIRARLAGTKVPLQDKPGGCYDDAE